MLALLAAIRAILFRLLRLAPRLGCGTRRPKTWAIDPLLARELQQFHVEGPEPNAVVEVAQMREFVAQRGDETRVSKRFFGHGVAEPDLDQTDSLPLQGERFDGFAQALKSGAGATVDQVNAKRRKIYNDRAASEGVSPDQIGRIYAKQIANKAPPGTKILQEDGAWIVK